MNTSRITEEVHDALHLSNLDLLLLRANQHALEQISIVVFYFAAGILNLSQVKVFSYDGLCKLLQRLGHIRELMCLKNIPN